MVSRFNIFLSLLLLSFAFSAKAAPNYTRDFFPLETGSSWSYRQGTTQNSAKILTGTTIINGVETTILETSATDREYYSITAAGLQAHRLLTIAGAGNQTITFTPALTIAAEELVIGERVVSSGNALFVDPGIGRINLDYSSTSTVLAEERVTVPSGTFLAIKVRWQFTISGSSSGGTVSETATQTSWLVRGIGPVKWSTTDSDGTTTSELLSFDVPSFKQTDKTVLWHNSSTGQVWMYDLDGNAISTSNGVALLSDLNWRIAGRGDLNNDGEEDVFLRNISTGHNWVWLIEDGVIAQSMKAPLITDTNWEVVDLNDVNGDGNADVLWRNTQTGQNWFWLMNGATILQSKGLPTTSAQNWLISGLADLDGDAKADIVWRNKSTGSNWVWLLDGASIKQSFGLPALVDQNWNVESMGDFDGDGQHDIFWRHAQTGRNYVWLMNAGKVRQSTETHRLSDLNWQVVSAKDFDGDGKSDLFWRNTLTGLNWMWAMNGTQASSSQKVNQVTDLNWFVPMPHPRLAEEVHYNSAFDLMTAEPVSPQEARALLELRGQLIESRRICRETGVCE